VVPLALRARMGRALREGERVLYLGLDDTDVAGSPGTNQLARRVARRLAQRCRLFGITRHQLLLDPRIPYTSGNSSAAIMVLSTAGTHPEELLRLAEECVREGAAPESAPGLCLAESVPAEVIRFGQRAKREVVAAAEAWEVARRADLRLVGLGGTGRGVVGALASVGLAATGEDGRFVQLGAWPDDLGGKQPAALLRERGVDAFLVDPDGPAVSPAIVDIGKRLRPSYRGGKAVLYVRRTPSGWRAERKT